MSNKISINLVSTHDEIPCRGQYDGSKISVNSVELPSSFPFWSYWLKSLFSDFQQPEMSRGRTLAGLSLSDDFLNMKSSQTRTEIIPGAEINKDF